jgi:cell division protein FtsI (penicillin-binding protein 3)
MSTNTTTNASQPLPEKAQRLILKRIHAVYLIVALLGIFITGKIVLLQFNSELKDEGRKISYKQEDLPAIRGNILANDGRVLAISLPYYELRVDMSKKQIPDSVFNKRIDGLAKNLANFFNDKTAAQYKAEIVKARNDGNRYKQVNSHLLTYNEYKTVQKFPLFHTERNEKSNKIIAQNALIPIQKSKRTTPYNRLAYRTIGWKNNNDVGVGIEDAFDNYLRGIPGKRTVQRLSGGEWMPVNSDMDIDPHDGMDVVSTLDVDIQDAAETALREQLAATSVFEAGTAIVMEVATGEIRAIANMKRNNDGTYDESFNYAIGWATEPGSTFKLATLISLLEDNYASLSTPVDVDGGKWKYYNKVFTDSHLGTGTVPLQEAFELSSNVGFAKSAVQYYKGRETQFVDRLYNMNLNKPLGLQIKGEATPKVSYPGDPTWSGLSLPMIAMGYEVVLTPMNTLTLYNAIANNGKMVKPKFVRAVRNKRGVVKEFPTEVISGSICSPSILRDVRTALRSVVEKGTARQINDTRYNISGKTGTSRLLLPNGKYDDNGYKKHQASFVGFFPSEAPKYSAIVVLYSEKTQSNLYGARWAAPAFKHIADKLYVVNSDWYPKMQAGKAPVSMPTVKGGKKAEVEMALNKLEIPSMRAPQDTQWVGVRSNKDNVQQISKVIADNELPSVLNMGLKDALFLLENMNLKVTFTGKGRVVQQSVEPGTKITKGQLVSLVLES